ncbi:PREDICTED: coiled-coil domain-containing protein 71L [Nanorana parkeri]|uniref:coiled-coil domain-containing protein 71L n=1 Tax=Nanorana parkeri TaxID=125878 RepID=UPI00085439BA|nr:PREDICTED: coiled-coil domain-containing protein 71L [Nanorana parkeri]
MEDEKVVYSRSQLVFAGIKPLEDALEIFVPESKHFMNSDTELWNFLCSLKRDFSPVILRSKDVYGYSSCRSVVPDPSQFSRKKAKEPAPAPLQQPKKPPVKRKRKGMRLSCRKRRRVKPAASEESGASGCSSPTPSEASGSLSTSLEDMWKAAAQRLSSYPTILVRDVSCEAKVAAARQRAQRILQVNLQPVVRIRRFPLISSS